MSSHSSFLENSYIKQFRQELNKIKSPFIEKIQASTQIFHTKIKAFQQKLSTQEKQDSEENEKYQPEQIQKYKQNQLDTEENLNEKQNEQVLATIQQFQTQKIHKKNKPSEFPLHLMKEWTGNSQFAFTNIEEVKQNFVNVFNKKLGVKKKQKKQKHYDFKEDEKNMLINIFHEVQNPYGPNKGFASIEKIIQFFQQNQLFYLFYNLHPNQLKYVLKDFARTRPDSLTQRQFLYLFFMDRPLLKDLSDPYEKIVHRKCILDVEGWQELKKIFTTLDTFGNQTIHVRPFFQKLKACHSNPSLIFTPVIEFPEIQRVYTLKKVVFDLQHKFKFNEKVQWKDIENVILNFNHKEEPTLDIIFQNHLEKATILLDSNYFLIDKKIIEFMKNIFEKCPKFSQFFVNTKFLCNQMLESHDLKPFYKNPIRQKTHIYGGFINLEEAIRNLGSKAPHYIDLDEFLEYFSIKGAITNILLEIHDEKESSDEQNEVHDERTKMLRRVRSLQKLQKSRKNKKVKRPVRQVTDFQQFNLTKKENETIRQKKLKEILRKKQQIEINELKKKFKANPIPADLNPQRLKEQQKKIEMKKRKKLQEVAKRRQQDKQIVNYLKANTKLFEPINKQTFEETVQNNTTTKKSPTKSFTHKPVPWFVQQNLLLKIQKEKQERKKKIYQQARLKYARSWNQLPDFFFKDEEHQNSAENSIIQELRKKNYEKQIVEIKANPVPDFKSLHKQFEQQLERKKKMFQPTQIQEFHLTSPKIQKKQVYSQYLSPQHKHNDRNKWRETFHSPPANKISTTKKVQDWMSHNKKIQQYKRAIKQEQKQKQKQRITKQKNFAKFMSKKLRLQQRQLPNLQAQTVQKLTKHRETVQYLQKLTEKELSEMYARVLQRPFLFEIGNSQHQVINKKQKNNKNIKKLTKKAVIKNIEAIDMSEQSTNKYNELNQEHDVNDQYRGDYNESSNQSNKQARHEGLNQSF